MRKSYFVSTLSYDKTNVQGLALRLWRKYIWGLAYFGQFIYDSLLQVLYLLQS